MRFGRVVVDDEGDPLRRFWPSSHRLQQRRQRRALPRGLAIENKDCGKMRGLGHRKHQVVIKLRDL